MLCREVTLPDLLQQTLRSVFHHIQDTLESVRTAIIGIRHFTFRMMTCIFEEQLRLNFAIRWCKALQNCKICPVHCQHIIESAEIIRFYLAPAQSTHIITALPRCSLRALIGLIADVVIMRTSRIDNDMF